MSSQRGNGKKRASSSSSAASANTSNRNANKRKSAAVSNKSNKTRRRTGAGAADLDADANSDDDDDRNDSDDEGDSDDSDASVDEITLDADDEDLEMMNVDFNFFDPKPIDQSYVRQLLARYTDTAPCDKDELSGVICRQASVGTVIKGDGSPNPLAFITALNLSRHKDLECVKQLKQFLVANASGATAQKMSALLNDATQCVGLIIQERIANLPIELVPHLHKSLLDDLSWAVQNEISDAHRAQFKFDKIVVLTRAMRGSVAQSQGKKTKKQKQKQHQGPGKGSGGSGSVSAEDTLYYRFEDDFYARNAEFAYKFPAAMTQTQKEKSDTVPEERVVLVIPFAGMAKVVKLIDSLCQ